MSRPMMPVRKGLLLFADYGFEMSRFGQPGFASYWLPKLLLSLLVLLTAVIYLQGVAGPWIFDDFHNLQSLYLSREAGWAVLLDEYLISHSGRLGRPVSMLTFIFSAVTSGESLVPWKCLNLGLHLLAGLAIFWCMRRLLEDIGGWASNSAYYGALSITALWLLHPLHVSTVLYTVQRMTILPALFCALGMGFYLSGRRLLATGQAGWGRVLLAFCLCWPLATLSKENGVLLGLYLLLLEVFLPPLKNTKQQRRIYCLLGFAVVLPVLVATVFFLLQPDWLLAGYRLRDFTPIERLLTESRILWSYVLWVFLPLMRFMGFLHDDISLSTGLLEPVTTIFALCAWLLVIGGMCRLYRRQTLAVLGGALFLVSHLLESTVIPLELAFEHRNYFGSVGLLLALVAVLSQAVGLPRLRGLVAGLGLAALAILLLMRVQVWADLSRLNAAIWLAHPTSPRQVTTIAAQYARTGDANRGLAVLETAYQPSMASVRLYILCMRDNALADAELDAAYTVPPTLVADYMAGALFYVARQGLEGECLYSSTRLVALMERMLASKKVGNSKRYKILIYKAHHEHRAENLDAALQSLTDAARLEPTALVPLSLQVEWLKEASFKAMAVKKYRQLQTKVSQSGVDFSARMQELAELLELRD